MAHGEAIPDFNFLAIFAADAEEGADYTLLLSVSAERVVEDGEDGLTNPVSHKGLAMHRRLAHLREDDDV